MSSIPETGRAVRIHEQGDISVLKLEQAPVKYAPDQVLVRNHYSGVNFIDTYYRSGVYPVQFPFTLGQDGGGEVVAIGSQVPESLGLKVGDLVAYMGNGSYAEYTAAPGNRVWKVPPGLDLATTVAGVVQGLTAVFLATVAYETRPGDWVLVHAAAGGTGSLVVQVAAQQGAHVIGVTSTPEKAELAKAHGAEHVLLSDDPELVQKVKDLTGGKGVRTVFDGVGAATWDVSRAVLGYQGNLLSFGNASGKVPPFEVLQLVSNNIRVSRPSLFEAAKGGPTAFQDLADKTFGWLRDGKLKVNVQHVYPLSDASQAHVDIQGRKTTGKLLLDPRL